MSDERWPTLQELRDAERNNPARPRTPFGSTAMGGGPAQDPQLDAAQAAQTAQPDPDNSDLGGMAAQAVLSTAAASPGGMVGRGLGKLAFGVGSRLAVRGAQLLGRSMGAAAGTVAGGELFAPAGETTEEANTRRIADAALGAGGEAVGAALHKGVIGPVSQAIKRRMGGEAIERMVPGALEAQAVLSERGATLTPGQALGGFWGTFEAMLRGSFLGSKVMERTHSNAVAKATAGFEDALGRVTSTMSTDELGAVLQSALKAYGSKAVTETVTETIPNVASRAAFSALDTLVEREGIGAAVDLTRVTGLEQIVKREQGLVSFERAFDIQESLQRAGLPKLATSVENAIKVAGLRLGPLGENVLNQFGVAQATKQISKEAVVDQLALDLAKKSPTKLVKAVINADSPIAIETVKRAINSPDFLASGGNPTEVWRELQGQYIATLRKGAGAGQFNAIDGRTLGSLLDNPKSSLSVLFTGEQRMAARNAARAIELAERAGTGTGNLLLQFKQTGAEMAAGGNFVMALGQAIGATKMASSTSPGEAAVWGAIILSPAAMARVVGSTRLTNMMLRRASEQVGQSGRAVSSFAGQFMAQMVKERIPFDFQRGQDSYSYDGTAAVGGAGLKPTSKIEAPQ